MKTAPKHKPGMCPPGFYMESCPACKLIVESKKLKTLFDLVDVVDVVIEASNHHNNVELDRGAAELFGLTTKTI